MDNFCFICFDEDNLIQSPCGCTNLYVHEACLLNLVHKMDTTTCSICTKTYCNLLVRKKTKCKMNHQYGILMFIISVELLLGTITVFLFSEMYRYTTKDTMYIIALCIVSLCFMFASYLLYCAIKVFLNDVPPFWIKQTKILEAHFLHP